MLSARNSFDPKTGRSNKLSFSWSFNDSNLQVTETEFTHHCRTIISGPVYDGVLKVSKTVSTYTTKAIRVRIQNVQPPVADAGFSMVLNQPKLLRDGGVKLSNFSFSPQTGSDSGLSYSWEPKSYFSNLANENSSSRYPKFIISEPGSYTVTLTVSENGLSSNDSITILVRAGRPPFAFAGSDHVIQLSDSVVELSLDRGVTHFLTIHPIQTTTGQDPYPLKTLRRVVQ